MYFWIRCRSRAGLRDLSGMLGKRVKIVVIRANQSRALTGLTRLLWILQDDLFKYSSYFFSIYYILPCSGCSICQKLSFSSVICICVIFFSMDRNFWSKLSWTVSNFRSNLWIAVQLNYSLIFLLYLCTVLSCIFSQPI